MDKTKKLNILKWLIAVAVIIATIFVITGAVFVICDMLTPRSYVYCPNNNELFSYIITFLPILILLLMYLWVYRSEP